MVFSHQIRELSTQSVHIISSRLQRMQHVATEHVNQQSNVMTVTITISMIVPILADFPFVVMVLEKGANHVMMETAITMTHVPTSV